MDRIDSSARRACCALFAIAMATTASAQDTSRWLPSGTNPVSLEGPRFGVTTLAPSLRRELAKNDVKVGSMITQFGWQFEHLFLDGDTPVTPVTEAVLLVGGLEQGVFLPSANFLMGLRWKQGVEVGVGPNVTPAGVALTIAAGTTFRSGSVNIPVNVAVVPSRFGTRLTLITGFTMR